MTHNRDMNTEAITNNPVLAAFAESVNAVRSGDTERIAAADAEWKRVVPNPPKWTAEDEVDGEDRYDDYRELSDGEYDRIADAYERRLGL